MKTWQDFWRLEYGRFYRDPKATAKAHLEAWEDFIRAISSPNPLPEGAFVVWHLKLCETR
jgi:hypothetical protein